MKVKGNDLKHFGFALGGARVMRISFISAPNTLAPFTESMSESRPILPRDATNSMDDSLGGYFYR